MFTRFGSNWICKAISVIEIRVRGIQSQLVFAKPNATDKIVRDPESENLRIILLEKIGRTAKIYEKRCVLSGHNLFQTEDLQYTRSLFYH
jgi:hypothetical protein